LFGYRVVHEYAHDPGAYCQGLLIRDGRMFESTGQYGGSSLREVELATGKVLRTVTLPREIFAEGLAAWADTLIQLTWKSHQAFVYTTADFKRQKTYTYAGEGWGLAANERELVMSDGTNQIRFLDPSDFHELRRIDVTSSGVPLRELNELEWVKGEILANVWRTDMIARIDPKSGAVIGWIDLTGICKERPTGEPDAVLNGIAYDQKNDRLFVTGKYWPKLYEIQLVPKN
jgi:glutamine cyclotransferase